MKIALKIIICFVILLLFNTRTQAQSIVEIDGDTLVLITRENVNTINSIITEREYLIEEVSVLSELNDIKDSIICDQDSIISIGQKILIQETERFDLEIQTQAIEIKREAEKKMKHRVRQWSGISALIGVILGFIIAN